MPSHRATQGASYNVMDIHEIGGLSKPEIDLLVLEHYVATRKGLEEMLEKKLDQTKEALDIRLDSQDSAILNIKEIALQTNEQIRELCSKHEGWHDGDLEFRGTIREEVKELQKDVKALRVLVTCFDHAMKFTKYIFEHGDKAAGLTMKLILFCLLILCGQNAYSKWLPKLMHMAHLR